MFTFTKCALLLCAVAASSGFAMGPQDIILHLLTRANPTISEPLLPTENSILSSVRFNPSRPSVFTIHSEADSATGNFNAFVVPAHIDAEDVNLFAVDWSPGCSMYSEGLGNAPQVGRVIAEFINILLTFGYDASLIRIVGVGLGGHIAGIAARNANGQIPHIVAIDPSFHGWTHHSEKLSPNAAGVVEVLHATAGSTGYDLPLGDLDFYPNGGSYQAGCGNDASCSHIYAYAFYAESLTAETSDGARFVGTRCEDYEQAVALQCSGAQDATFGGTAAKTGQSGIYTFLTNPTQPFARG